MPRVEETARARLRGRRVPAVGPQPARLLLVGERPGVEEAIHGQPFVGAAGRILNALLPKAGIARGKCRITNLVLSYEEMDPTAEEIERDRGELEREIRATRPEFVGALGAYAARHWLPGKAMEMVHGIPHRLEVARGIEAIVVPIFHPASGLYDPESLGLTYWDLEQLAGAMKGEIEQPQDEYWGKENYRRIGEGGGLPGGAILLGQWALDTEGTREEPWGGSLSAQPGAAYVFPARRPPAIGSECKIIMHHALHDLLILAGMGMEIEDEQIEDTLLKAYALGGVHPLGLKALAYRLCGMTMSSYEEVMGAADRGIAMEYLRQILEFVPDARPGAEGNGRGQSLHQRVKAILRDAEAADPRARWRKVIEDRPEWGELVGYAMPQAGMDDVPEREAIRYSARDADATRRISEKLDQELEAAGTRAVYEQDRAVLPAVNRMRQVGVKIEATKLTALGERLGEEMAEIAGGLGLNPDSGDQVADYLFCVLRLRERRKTKKGRRGATDDRVLEGMWGEHEDVRKIIAYRERSKLRSNFCQKLVAMADERGRIHADLAARANSGRFTAKVPNLLAIPARTELGREVRAAVVAEEGNVLGDWDYNQIEMRIMADESGDEELCRLFREGKDVHANTACRMFGIGISQMKEEEHRYPAKRVGFGTITGITGQGLVEQMNLAGANRDGRWTAENCREMIEEFVNGIYPGIGRYMERCRAEARRFGYVRDRWGRRRWLPGVWAPIARVRAEAERQSHSHKIQGGAAGLIKEAIARLWPWFRRWREEEGRKAEMLLPVHDELLIEIEDDPEFRQLVAAVMTGEMQGAMQLAVPIVAKGNYGRNWRDAKK